MPKAKRIWHLSFASDKDPWFAQITLIWGAKGPFKSRVGVYDIKEGRIDILDLMGILSRY